ncbi:MAG: SLC13 family permease [Methylococcaceae bacterium]
MNISVLTLVAVFVLIAVRKIGHFNIKIWQSMTGGALVVMAAGEISGPNALKAIDFNVMLFLFGMFVVGQALVASGYLYALAYVLFNRMTSVPQLVCGILFGAALSSALLMNDTLAIIGTPLVALYLPMLTHPSPESLMALAAGSTIAGNLLILGAASNVIIIQHAEKHQAGLGFFEFARVGIPLGFINLLIYWTWFRYGYG